MGPDCPGCLPWDSGGIRPNPRAQTPFERRKQACLLGQKQQTELVRCTGLAPFEEREGRVSVRLRVSAPRSVAPSSEGPQKPPPRGWVQSEAPVREGREGNPRWPGHGGTRGREGPGPRGGQAALGLTLRPRRLPENLAEDVLMGTVPWGRTDDCGSVAVCRASSTVVGSWALEAELGAGVRCAVQ